MKVPDAARLSPVHTVATLTCTAASLVLISALLPMVYTPNLERIRNHAINTINPFVPLPAAPEPLEQMQYAVLVSASLILLFGFAFVFSLVQRRGPVADARVRWILQLPAWLLGSLALVASIKICEKNNFLYLQHSMFVKYPRTHFIVILPLAFLLYHWGSKRLLDRVFWLVRPLLALIVIGVALTNSLFTANSPPSGYHFNPVVYPLALLLNGAPIGDGTLSLYGFYPTYMAPLVALLGGGITAACSVFGLLMVVTYLALILVASWIIKNPFLKLCVAFALPYMSYLSHTLKPDPYYQYWPIRMLFPALVLLALAWSVRTSRYQRCALGLAAGLAVTGLFWNLDSGAACLLSVLAFALVRVPFRLMKGGLPFWSVAKTATGELVLPMIGGALPAIALFYVMYRIQVGLWPEVLRSMATIRTLADVGYSFLPLPDGLAFWHVWAFALGVCALFSFRLFLGMRERLASFQVAVAVLGLASLVYYVGRSHEYTLIAPLWLAPLALGLTMERLDENMRGVGPFVFGRVAHLLVLAHLVSAPVACVLDLNSFWKTGTARIRAALRERKQSSMLGSVGHFIRTHSRKHPQILIFAVNAEGQLYLLSRRRPAIEMSSSTDLLLQTEHARIVEYLERNVDTPVFVADSDAAISVSPSIVRVLASHYQPVATVQGIKLLERKREK